MRAAALVLLAGCSTIFGLSDPHLVADAGAGDASDAPDGNLADAAPGHCVTIADCPTSVCLPSTLCAADADVAWLDSTATTNQACTMAMPCNTMNDALSTNRPYIRFHGALRPMSSINQDVSIFGEPNARFSNGNLQTSANVGLYDLEISSACVQVMSGSLTAVHINLHACAGVGITANGALTLDRSTIALNRGGISIASPTFSITNNFIIYNGLPGGGGSSNVGGIAITAPAADMTSQIAFNTIAENTTASSGSVSGGLYCNIQTFTALANVIVHNSAGGSTATVNANTGGTCQHAASIVQVSDDVGFVGVASADFHLTAASELVDATQVLGPPDDIDREPRPFGSGYDIGADEYHP